MRTSTRESHFIIWKNRIEKHIQTHFDYKITLDDFPDEPYRMWFEESNAYPKEISDIIVSHLYDY